ncbi:MAG: UvrD-helicase domain-containing protein [Pirellulales bacterium]
MNKNFPPNLNAAQLRAVSAPAGPLLVLAGAGTGKTRVVISRIAQLVKRGACPSRILAVTFTNRAAREMLGRANQLLKRKKDGPKPEISTIHSLCVRILRRHASRLGYPERFIIIDRGDQEGTARKVLKDLRVPDASLRPADLLQRVSRWKSVGIRPADAFSNLSADADESWELAAAGYRRYQEALKAVGAMDFDDLLISVDALFTTHEDIRQKESRRFDHILVDEYQDTSGIQERILMALARDHQSLCVVGDDDQSIYAWRGAQIHHILDFAHRWPDATVVRLEENYRSTPEIIKAANALITHNSKRHGKTLVSKSPAGVPPTINQAQDEVNEAQDVVSEVESLLREGATIPAETAILVRTGEQTRVFEQELRRRDIPYELIGSRSFFDRREVKDILAFLRLIIDPNDDMALSRIANVPPRGLSNHTIEKCRNAASIAGRSLWQELEHASNNNELTRAARGGMHSLEQLVALRDSAATVGAAETLRIALDQVGYKKYLERVYDDDLNEAEARWLCVEDVVNALAQHEKTHRITNNCNDFVQLARQFLDDLILEITEAERLENDQDKGKGNKLRLMTLHAAKGLEFDCVWMVGMEEGLLPHVRSLKDGIQAVDEERRLCYVGVTRARKRLALTLCLTRMKWGKTKPCRPSRFLYELTEQAEKFEPCSDDMAHTSSHPKAKEPRKRTARRR